MPPGAGARLEAAYLTFSSFPLLLLVTNPSPCYWHPSRIKVHIILCTAAAAAATAKSGAGAKAFRTEGARGEGTWALGHKLTPSTHSHSIMGLHQTRRFLTLTLFQWLMWGFAPDYLYSGTCGWKLFSSTKFCSLLFCRLSARLIFLPFRVGFLAWKRRPQDPIFVPFQMVSVKAREFEKRPKPLFAHAPNQRSALQKAPPFIFNSVL